jgi:hypothetical protein
MKIVPPQLEEQINRVDPARSRVIGIVCAIIAGLSAFWLLWMIYDAAVLSSFGISPVYLIFGFVFRGVIFVVAAIAAIGFLQHAKQP